MPSTSGTPFSRSGSRFARGVPIASGSLSGSGAIPGDSISRWGREADASGSLRLESAPLPTGPSIASRASATPCGPAHRSTDEMRHRCSTTLQHGQFPQSAFSAPRDRSCGDGSRHGWTSHRVKAAEIPCRSHGGRSSRQSVGSPAAAEACAARCSRRVAAIGKPLPSATTAATPRLRIACSIIHATLSARARSPRRRSGAAASGISANHDARSSRRSAAADPGSLPPAPSRRSRSCPRSGGWEGAGRTA